MKRLILIGEQKSENLGDQVICETAKCLFSKDNEIDVTIFDISYARNLPWPFFKIIRRLALLNPAFCEKFIYYITYLRFSLKKRPDKIVFAGGALIHNYFMSPISAILRCAEKKKITVRFFSVGYDKLDAINENRLIKSINNLQNVEITVRDNPKYLETLLHRKIDIYPDIAVLCSKLYHAAPKRGIIGVGCIDPSCYQGKNGEKLMGEVYCESMVKLCNNLLSSGFCIELFTNGNNVDQEVAERIYGKISNPNITLAERPSRTTELTNLISSYDAILSSRLHSLIIAYSFSIPSICLAWNHKIEDFANLANNRYVIDLASMNNTNWSVELNKCMSEGVVLDSQTELKIENQIKKYIYE